MGSAPLKGKSSHDPNGHEDDTAPTSPRGSEPCENGGVFQAGGHGKLSKDPLLEGVIRKPANDAEIVFYQTLNGDDAQLSTVPTHIRAFFPQFHGVSDKKFILLQDLTHNLKKACVMDIKMGTKTYTSDSNVLKQWMLEHKDGKTTTQALGFRITGFRTFKKATNEYDVKGKAWGMALRPDDVAENLVTFFDDGTTIRLDVVQKFIDRLEVLFPWYSLQNIIKIYSSSLLFVYDSEGPADSAEVHMIDFAHVKRIEDPEERDHGYIAGLRNLIDIFKQIRDTNLGVPGSSTPTTPNPKAPSSPRSATSSSHTKSTDSAASPPHPNTNPPHLDLPVSAEKPKRKRHGSNAAHSAAASTEDDAATTGDKNGHTGRSSVDGEAKTPKSPRSHKTPKSPRTPSSAASEDPASARSGDTHVLVLDLGPDTTTTTKEKRKSAKRRKAHKETEGVIYGESARDDREAEPVEKI